ncbi:hypothetical protein ER308_11030 [Egibacter rhizosphaerae]|uniref:Pilus assembly protein n=1 Tax=Egibacter rhizosphaerae TaxID=1670831 RepID=A0A411YFN8_9ACTN|nr:hypothetical protein [Egibacter rhizosphaerae]QBI20040.1 hypothetical protein ER308_11030 [Egibacter rhizosphaerae]
MSIGVLVFLVLLFTAVHTLTYLYAQSVVEGVTYEVALQLSAAVRTGGELGGDPTDPTVYGPVYADAEGALGGYADRVELDPPRVESGEVVVRVEAEALGLAPAATSQGFLTSFEREVRMRLEGPQ